MGKRVMRRAIAFLLAACFASPALPADDASVKRDLFFVIALQGLPCSEVVSVVTLGENDHIASCKDGNRYRVFLNAQGRVVVEKQ